MTFPLSGFAEDWSDAGFSRATVFKSLMLDHPENIEPLDTAQMDRIASLVAGVETD